MVLPRWLAKANRTVTNRILGRIPARWNPFVTLHHVGRRSGRPYTVPLAGFRTGDGFILTPTYGPDADWVRNVLAAGSFHLDRKQTTHHLERARLVNREEAWPFVSPPIRLAMRVLAVRWFVRADHKQN